MMIGVNNCQNWWCRIFLGKFPFDFIWVKWTESVTKRRFILFFDENCHLIFLIQSKTNYVICFQAQTPYLELLSQCSRPIRLQLLKKEASVYVDFFIVDRHLWKLLIHNVILVECGSACPKYKNEQITNISVTKLVIVLIFYTYLGIHRNFKLIKSL